MNPTLLGTLITAIAALLGSFVGAQLKFRGFKNEKRFERKMELVGIMIKYVMHAHRRVGDVLEALERGDSQSVAEIEAEMYRLDAELEPIEVEAGSHFSQSTIATIKKLTSYSEQLDPSYDSGTATVELAKKDLRKLQDAIYELGIRLSAEIHT